VSEAGSPAGVPGPGAAAAPPGGAAAAPEPVLATVLATVEIGPPAAGARQALGALRYYAGHPEAGPAPAPLDRVLWGAGHSLAAARLVLTDRALRRAAVLPTALTVAGCVLLAAGATLIADPEQREAAGVFHRFLIAFVALAALPPTILQRLWVRVALQARRALGLPEGEDPTAGLGLMRIWWREGLKALRQGAAAALSLLPFAIALQLLPFSGLTKAAAAAAWAFYWLVVDAFEIPMDVVAGPRPGAGTPWFARLLLGAGGLHRSLRAVAPAGRGLARLVAPWNEELRFTERHPWESLGFGLVMGAVLAVPVLGLFFRAVGIAAATSLLGRLEAAELPGGAAAGGAGGLDENGGHP